MRITPRITPHIPNPRNLSPKSLARSAPRALLTGNFPHPRIGGISASGVTGGGSISKLTQKSSTGRTASTSTSAKPKTASQLTGYSTSGRARAPRSMAAQRPGHVKTIKGAKMKVQRSNPFKLPKIHL